MKYFKKHSLQSIFPMHLLNYWYFDDSFRYLCNENEIHGHDNGLQELLEPYRNGFLFTIFQEKSTESGKASIDTNS